MTVFVVEDLEERTHRRLFTLLDVSCLATARAWLNIPLMFLAGVAIAMVIRPDDGLASGLLSGVAFGALISVSSFCHGLGHAISSRMVGAPMTSMILTATVGITRFEDSQEQPSRIHIGRSLGGPALNLTLGLAAIPASRFVGMEPFIIFFAVVNVLFGVFTLLPISSLDGSVIWRSFRERGT